MQLLSGGDGGFQHYQKCTGRIDEEADGEKAFFQNQRRRYLRGLRHEPEKLLLSFPGQI